MLNRLIAWNATIVMLGAVDPDLEIDSNGNIITHVNISATLNAGTFDVANIVNIGALDGSMTFTIPASFYDTMPSGYGTITSSATITGAPSVIFHTGFDQVTIFNQSIDNLLINQINVINPSTDFTANINIDVGTHTGFTPIITSTPGDTKILIQNDSTISTPNITFNDVITNPDGTTTAITAGGNIISGSDAATIETTGLVLQAPSGFIGTSTAPIEAEATGMFAALAQSNIYISETGTLDLGYVGAVLNAVTVNGVDSTGGTVDLYATASLVNDPGNTANTANILAPVIILDVPNGAIGTLADPVDIGSSGATTTLTAVADTGVTIDDVADRNALDIASVTDTAIGAGVTGNVTITTIAQAASGEDIVLGATSLVTANSGTITLQAGDNLTTAVGSVISASGTVTVGGDYNAAVNPIGKLIQLQGVINGSSATITSGTASDTIYVTNVAANTPTTIAGGGNDIITIGSIKGSSPLNNGLLNRIDDTLTINGGTNGNSTLTIDDTGDATNTTGTLGTLMGDAVLSGLGMGAVIQYVDIATTEVALGSGSDIFNVQATLAGTTTTVVVGVNGNTVRVGGPNGNLTDTVNNIQGLLNLDGNGTNAVLNVVNAGETRATTGILDNGHLTGLGMGSSSPSTVNAGAGIQFSGFTDVNIMLGSGADNFTVGSISNLTTINTGTGGDTVTVGLSTGTNGLTEIDAPLLIQESGNANDQLVVLSNVSSALTLDQASPTVGLVTGIGTSGQPGRIEFAGVTTLTVDQSDVGHVDTLTINNTVTDTVVESGGGGHAITVNNVENQTTLDLGADDTVTVFDATTVNSNAVPALSVVGNATNTLTLDLSATTAAVNALIEDGATPGTTGILHDFTASGGDIGFNSVGKVNVNLGTGNDLVVINTTDSNSVLSLNGGDGDDFFDVDSIGDTTNITGGNGTDTVALIITAFPTANEFALLNVDVENLFVDNSAYSGAVAWTNLDGMIYAASGDTSNLVVNSSGAQLTRIIGGSNPDNTLNTATASANSVIGTVTDHEVVLESGLDVLSGGSTDNYLNYGNVMTFDGLTVGNTPVTSYGEDGFTLTTNNALGFQLDETTSASAEAQSTSDTFTLAATNGSPFSLYSMQFAANTALSQPTTIDVTFTGHTISGGTVTVTKSVTLDSTDFTTVNFTTADGFSGVTTVSWNAGSASPALFTAVDNIVAVATPGATAFAGTPVVPTFTINGNLTFDTSNGTISSGSITIDPQNGGASTTYNAGASFAGTGISEQTISGKIAQFTFDGDLVIGAGVTITASGSNGISIVATNNVTINPGATFDASAVNITTGLGGSTAGPGGGGGGGNGGGGPGGYGQSTNPQGGQAGQSSNGAYAGTYSNGRAKGGAGGSGEDSGYMGGFGGFGHGGGGGGGGGGGYAGYYYNLSFGTDGHGGNGGRGGNGVGGTGGSSGGGGGSGIYNNNSGSAGSGLAGSGGLGGGSGTGGGGGGAGTTGTGGNPGKAPTGVGVGGTNSVNGSGISGGMGGGAGGGGGGGGAGGGGGGASGGNGSDDLGFFTVSLNAGNGGNGGSSGAAGGTGGAGGMGGGGGGAFQIIANGTLNVVSDAQFSAEGGSGQQGSGGSGTPAGEGSVAGGSGQTGGNGAGSAGGGGSGGTGGTGAPGAGGAGGTIKIVGTVLTATGAEINVQGGTGATDAGLTAPDGGQGRVIVGSNTDLTLKGQTIASGISSISGAPLNSNITPTPTLSTLPTYTTGELGTNPVIDPSASISDTTPYLPGISSTTPNIAGLIGGAALDGLISGITLPTISGEPSTALVAIESIDVHTSANNILGVQYNGYNLLLVVNLTSVNLPTPELGVITSNTSTYQADLETGGAVTGTAATLTALDAGAVWAVLVPDTTTIAVNATIGNPSNTSTLTGTVSDQTLNPGGVVYVTSQNNALNYPPNISGFNAEAVSPDGKQIYAVNTAQNALVVVNTSDLSQRQLFEQSYNGVNGLQGATGVAVSPNGAYVYVSSSQGITVFQRNTTTGDLTLDSALSTTATSLQSHVSAGQTDVFDTIALSPDGSTVYVGGTDGIVSYSWSNTTGLSFVAAAGTSEGVSDVSAIEQSPSTNATYSNDLFAVSSSGDTLYLLNATTLTNEASLSGPTQQGLALTGASDVVVSSDGVTVFVSGEDSDAISIFQRTIVNSAPALMLNQTLQDGFDGVRGLAEPDSLALSPDGQYLMATGQLSDDIAVFALNTNDQQWQFVQVVRNNNGGVTGLFGPDALVTVDGTGGPFTYVADFGDTNDLGGITKFSIATSLPPPISDVTTFANIEGLSVNTEGNDDTITLAAAGPPPFNPATSVNNNTINFGIPDNLTTGDALTYSTNGGTAISGLQNGQIYYAIADGPNMIELASSRANALAGIAIAISSVGVTGTAHQLSAAGTLPEIPLLDPSQAVDNTTHTVNFGVPIYLSTGDQITYVNNGGTPISGLVSGDTYYVIAVGTGVIALASSLANAQAFTPIPISWTGSQGTPPDYSVEFSVAGRITALPFITPSTAINNSTNTLNFGIADNLITGEEIGYSSGGGTPISGLQDGKNYYVITAGPDAIKLASSQANALAGTAILITSAGATGTQHQFIVDGTGSAQWVGTSIGTGTTNLTSKKNTVVLEQISATTVVYLGAGSGDVADIQSSTPGAALTVNGDQGGDTINLEQVGYQSTTTFEGGPGRDIVYVAGSAIPASATVTLHGNNPQGVPADQGDDLYFDPGNNNVPNFTSNPSPPSPNQGTISASNNGTTFGTVTYDTFEGIQVIAAPIITFQNTPYVTSEGDTITLTALITPLGTGNTLTGEGWSLTGSGTFGDATGTYDASTDTETLTLTARQLLALGIGNAGTYTIGLEATNGSGLTSEKFTTLTILYAAPVIAVNGASTTTVGTPYTISFGATSPVPDPITQWVVNWGDGTTLNPDLQTFGAGTSMATHTYTVPGTPEIQVSGYDVEAPTTAVGPGTLTVTVTVNQASVSAGGPYTIAEGQTLDLAAIAPGTPTSFSWDINGNLNAATGQDATLTWAQLEALAHPVNDNGTFTVTVDANYGGTNVTSSTNLIVTDTPPTATLVNNGPVNEGSSTATVSFTNVFSPSAAQTAAGFTYEYDFTNTGNFVLGSGPTATVPTVDLLTPGAHVVNAEILDSYEVANHLAGTIVSTTIQVNYVAPILTLSGNPTVAEGSTYQLTVSAQDPGTEPIQSWIVNWGDGSAPQTFAGPTPSNGTQVTFTHAFSADGPLTISVTAVDADGSVSATKGVTVSHVAPQLQNVSATAIDENGQSQLTGTILSVSSQDTYTLNVIWGDGTKSTLNLAAGATNFTLGHTYLDNPPDGTLNSAYTVGVTLTDSENAAATTTITAQVLNVAPIISGVALSAPTILENGTETVSGVIIDPGSLDTQTVTVNWGDGTSTVDATVNQTTRTFTATHQYLDDSLPDGTYQTVNGVHQGTYTITLTDTDKDAGVGTASTSVVVQNVAPLVSQLSVADAGGAATMTPNSPITLTGAFVDPGTLDTHVVTVNWGDGTTANPDIQTFSTLPAGVLTFAYDHTYTLPGAFTISVTVTDKDGGVGTGMVLATITGVALNNGQLIIGGDGTVTVREPATPVAYWSLNDPQGSTTITDSTANPDNGTYYPGPVGNELGVAGVPASLAPCGAGTAVSFYDYKSDYIGIADSSKFHLANGTVEFSFWPRFTTLIGSQTLFSKGAAGDPNSLTIGLNGEDLVVTLGGNTIQTGPLISAQTAWYNLSFSFGSGGMQLYLNGVLVGQNAYTGGLTLNQDDIVLGGSDATTPLGVTNTSQLSITTAFDGLIDGVAIYNFALSAPQVQNVMQAGPLVGASNANGSTIEVYASFLPGPTHILDFQASQVTSILAELGNGNDILRIDPSVSVPATIYYGNGNDQIYAGSGPSNLIPSLAGGNGNDILVGGSGNDIITAGHGTDYLVGGGGNDVITGGGGNDTLGVPPTTVAPISYWILNQANASGTIANSTETVYDTEGVENGNFYAVGTTQDLSAPGPSLAQAPYGAGTAAEFIGSPTDFIGIANNAAFQVESGTVSFWFNAATLQGQQTIFSKASNGVQDVPLTIGLNGGQLVAQLGAAGSDTADGGTIASSQSVAANTWYNVALSFGVNGMSLYLNGNLVGTSAFAGGLALNQDAIVIGGSNALTPIGRTNPAGQRITNSFDGEVDQVALYGKSLDQIQVQGVMSNGPPDPGFGRALNGLAGGLANYTFAYVNGILQATNTTNSNVTTIYGVGSLTFGDGTVALVLNSGSPSTPFLTLSQAQSLAPDGKLAVIGDGNQPFELIKPASGVAWTAGASVMVGQTGYVPWTNGTTTVLVINGQPAKDPVAPDTPTAAQEEATGPISAVAIEQVNPSQLLSLIQGSNITIPVQEVGSTTSGAQQTLLFDENTGALMLAIDSAELSATAPSLLIDSLGEEWVFVPNGSTTASLVQISGALTTRDD